MGCSGSKDVNVTNPASSPQGKITIYMNYQFKNPADKDAIKATLDKCVAYNEGAGMFGSCVTNFRFRMQADGEGYWAVESFCDAEAAEKYYRKFEECPDMNEFIALAEKVEAKKVDIIATAEEIAKAPTITLYYPKETAPNNYV